MMETTAVLDSGATVSGSVEQPDEWNMEFCDPFSLDADTCLNMAADNQELTWQEPNDLPGFSSIQDQKIKIEGELLASANISDVNVFADFRQSEEKLPVCLQSDVRDSVVSDNDIVCAESDAGNVPIVEQIESIVVDAEGEDYSQGVILITDDSVVAKADDDECVIVRDQVATRKKELRRICTSTITQENCSADIGSDAQQRSRSSSRRRKSHSRSRSHSRSLSRGRGKRSRKNRKPSRSRSSSSCREKLKKSGKRKTKSRSTSRHRESPDRSRRRRSRSASRSQRSHKRRKRHHRSRSSSSQRRGSLDRVRKSRNHRKRSSSPSKVRSRSRSRSARRNIFRHDNSLSNIRIRLRKDSLSDLSGDERLRRSSRSPSPGHRFIHRSPGHIFDAVYNTWNRSTNKDHRHHRSPELSRRMDYNEKSETTGNHQRRLGCRNSPQKTPPIDEKSSESLTSLQQFIPVVMSSNHPTSPDSGLDARNYSAEFSTEGPPPTFRPLAPLCTASGRPPFLPQGAPVAPQPWGRPYPPPGYQNAPVPVGVFPSAMPPGAAHMLMSARFPLVAMPRQLNLPHPSLPLPGLLPPMAPVPLFSRSTGPKNIVSSVSSGLPRLRYVQRNSRSEVNQSEPPVLNVEKDSCNAMPQLEKVEPLSTTIQGNKNMLSSTGLERPYVAESFRLEASKEVGTNNFTSTIGLSEQQRNAGPHSFSEKLYTVAPSRESVCRTVSPDRQLKSSADSLSVGPRLKDSGLASSPVTRGVEPVLESFAKENWRAVLSTAIADKQSDRSGGEKLSLSQDQNLENRGALSSGLIKAAPFHAPSSQPVEHQIRAGTVHDTRSQGPFPRGPDVQVRTETGPDSWPLPAAMLQFSAARHHMESVHSDPPVSNSVDHHGVAGAATTRTSEGLPSPQQMAVLQSLVSNLQAPAPLQPLVSNLQSALAAVLASLGPDGRLQGPIEVPEHLIPGKDGHASTTVSSTGSSAMQTALSLGKSNSVRVVRKSRAETATTNFSSASSASSSTVMTTASGVPPATSTMSQVRLPVPVLGAPFPDSYRWPNQWPHPTVPDLSLPPPPLPPMAHLYNLPPNGLPRGLGIPAPLLPTDWRPMLSHMAGHGDASGVRQYAVANQSLASAINSGDIGHKGAGDATCSWNTMPKSHPTSVPLARQFNSPVTSPQQSVPPPPPPPPPIPSMPFSLPLLQPLRTNDPRLENSSDRNGLERKASSSQAFQVPVPPALPSLAELAGGDGTSLLPSGGEVERTTRPAFSSLKSRPKPAVAGSSATTCSTSSDGKSSAAKQSHGKEHSRKASNESSQAGSSHIDAISNRLQEKVDKSIVAELVKSTLRPYFVRGDINKDEYKDIMRKSVPKIALSRTMDEDRIAAFIGQYVAKIEARRNRLTAASDTASNSS